jgi:hypothetical protein
MKGLKLSKTSWLILSAGIFLVVLAGLGVTRSGQVKEQTRLEEELGISESRLEKMQLTSLQTQMGELQGQLDESESQLVEAKDRLRQTVLSVDVTEKFFEIAKYSEVVVMNLGTSTIAKNTIAGVDCFTISLGATVTGDLNNMVDFIINLNQGYTTGYVKSVQISLNSISSEVSSGNANIQMIVYSYKGS